MPPRPSGHVVPRNGTAPAARTNGTLANGTSGEAWTHGQFERAVATIRAHLDQVPAKNEAMLRDLRSVEAGRTQVEGVMWIYRTVAEWIAQIDAGLTDSNRRAKPVVGAVAGAGGPEEIAAIRYYREV